jgi:hypothetical protein
MPFNIEHCFFSFIQWYTCYWQSMPQIQVLLTVTEHSLRRIRSGDGDLELGKHKMADAWQTPEVFEGIRKWATAMNEVTFSNGSVVEIFIYVFSLYIVSPSSTDEWLLQSRRNVTCWLKNLAYCFYLFF